MVGGAGMGVSGAAAATVIAQGACGGHFFCILMWLLSSYPAEGRTAWFRRDMFATGVKIAVPSIVQQSIVSIGYVVNSVCGQPFWIVGTRRLLGRNAAGIALHRADDCNGQCDVTFTAQNLGAGNQERVHQGYHAAYGIIIAFGVVLILVSQLFYRPVLAVFVEQGESAVAFETGTSYFRFIGLFFSILGFKAITDGILRGAGTSKYTCSPI